MLKSQIGEQNRLIVIGLALISAFGAQFFFTGEVFTHFLDSNTWEWKTTYTIASLLLLLALVGAVWIFAKKKDEGIRSIPVVDPTPIPKNWTWMIALCYLSSILFYLVIGENLFVQGLWLAGIGLLLIPLWRQATIKSADETVTWQEWLFVILITMIGFGLRYWNLLGIPSHIDNDIALIGNNSLKLIQTGNFNWIGPSESNGLLSYDQMIAWSMRLFGENQYGVVMNSVLFGTASIPIVYFLGRELKNPRVGMIAAALLTVSYTHIQFSRILFGTGATFFAIIAFYSLLKGLRTQRPFWYALSGVEIGLGLLTYESSRVVPVLMVLLIAWQWIWHRPIFKTMLKQWFLLFSGMLAGFGPNLGFALTSFTKFNGRGNDVMLWSPVVWQHETSTYQTNNVLQILWEQGWRTFLTLHLTGDGSPQFGIPRPMVSSLTAALLIFGVAYCLVHIKQLKYFYPMLWVVITFILGGVLSYDSPFWPHLNITLPAIMVLAAIGADEIAQIFEGLFQRYRRLPLNLVLAAAIVTTGVLNWQTYYNFVKDNAGPRIRMSRFINSLPLGYRVYLIDSEHTWDVHIFQFFNRSVTGENIEPDALSSNPPQISQPVVFILFNHAEVLPTLQERYPNGIIEMHDNNENNLVFISYRIVPTGYMFSPEKPPENLLSHPGWWLIFTGLAVIIFYIGYGLWNRFKQPAVSASS